jgi:hypothetical protein
MARRFLSVSAALAGLAQASGSASAAAGSAMHVVTTVHARVQSDAPAWDAEQATFVSAFGDTFAQKYRAALDTVNTASVEGALMYAQAEGINVQDNPGCARKNDMQYVVFYALQIRQTDATVDAYDAANSSTLPEYGPFIPMDSGACTLNGTALSADCLALYGGGQGGLDVGPSVGAGIRETDPRAPYPDTIWFSLPNSCVMQTWPNKNDSCRAQYPGGLCAYNSRPDGQTCTFTYKTLGYLNLDDLVGITSMTSSITDEPYANYTEFCMDHDGAYAGIEFSADDDNAADSVVSIPFWSEPFNESACANRTAAMIDMYNTVAVPADSRMIALPSIEKLAEANPPCYQNSPRCAEAEYGCKRELYAQVCVVCEDPEDGCVSASYSFDEVER